MSASEEPVLVKPSSTSETPPSKVSDEQQTPSSVAPSYASGDDSNVGTASLLDESITMPSNGSIVTTRKGDEHVGPSGDSHVPFDDTASVKSDCSSVASSKRSAIPKYTKLPTKSVTSTSATSASPSKISRPCAGHEKPSLPETPPKFGSMDALWETHCHRGLSEAGLSRHADHTVLTEDTDGFIIGQKVWVGGTKPGKIAYIGETQFAPGEWAGIVLDQPIGKNDGSVAGVRYFQCEPKHGVFSRLTRLTSVPLPGADLGDTAYTFTPPSPTNNNTRRSPLSPTGSTKGLYRSQPFNVSATSLSSPSHVDFKVGDRVIIKSSQGSKVGVVRYMGTTEFAPGEWCGVELDEPRGKNDGSVEGKRYFACRPLFGLFAPLAKVSKSPLKYKPGNCVIHSPAGLKKAGSRESMTSMNSSMVSGVSGISNIRRVRLGVNSLNSQSRQNTPSSAPVSTRTALQDVLREKQQHIEQLLKERDLERGEINRAASQADEAEQKLATLQSEYEKYRSECELKLKEFSGLLSTLNVDKNDLLSQLEEEKRKNEDILFRFEETAITKGDIEVENERNKTKIKELEEKLKAEHQKVENLEADSQKLFETEEALVSTRDELESLKNEIDNLKSKRLEEKKKLLSKDDEINKLKNLLEVTSQEASKVTKTKEDELNEKLKQQENEVERHKREIAEKENNCLLQINEIKELKEELALTKKTLEEKSSELEKVTLDRNEQQKEIEKLKMKLSSVLLDVEKMNDEIKQNESSFKILQRDYDASVINLKAKDDEIISHKKHAQEMEKDFKAEIERLRNSLQNATAEKEKSDHQNELISSKKDKHLKEASAALEVSKRETETLKNKLEELKQKAEKEEEQFISRHKREVEDKNEAIATLTVELQKQRDELAKTAFIVSKLEGEIKNKNGILSSLQYELDTVKNQYQIQMESQNAFEKEIKGLQVDNLDLTRYLQTNQETINRLTEDKRRLENEIQAIVSSSGDYSVKLQQITNEMLEKDRRLEMLSNEYKERIQEYARIENSLKAQLNEAQEESRRNQQHFQLQLQKAQECENNLRKGWDEATSNNKTLTEGFLNQLTEAKDVLSEKELALSRYMNEAEERERQLKTQVEMVNKELRKVIESCNTKLGGSEVEIVKLKGELSAKSEQISELELKVKLCQLEAEQRSENMQKDYESILKKKDFDIEQMKVALSTLQDELKLAKSDCNLQNVDINAKNSHISVLTQEITQLRHLVEKLQLEKDELLTSITDSKEKFVINSQQCADLMEQVTELTKKAKLADDLTEELNLQQAKLSHFVTLLDISEERKQNAISELRKAMEASGENEKCKHILDMVKDFQATAINSDIKKINDLQNMFENAKNQLDVKSKQLEEQNNEITRLQEQLLQMQQVPPSGPDFSNGQTLVSLVPSFQPNTVFTPSSINETPLSITNPNYYSKVPSEILVPLVTAKNLTLKIFSNLVFSHQKTSGLLNEIRYAVQTNNMQLLFTILRNYPTNFLNSNDKKLISLYLSKVNKGILNIYVQLRHQSNVIQYLLSHIKNTQNMYNRLPVQCKLHSSDINFNQPDKLTEFLKTKVQELHTVINDKNKQIEELQNFAFKMYNSRVKHYGDCTFNKPQGAHNNYMYVPKTNNTLQKITQSDLNNDEISPRFYDSASISHSPEKCPNVKMVYVTVPKIIPNRHTPINRLKLYNLPPLHSKKKPLPKIIYIPVPQKPRVIIKEVVVPVSIGSNNESVRYQLLPKGKDASGKLSLPPPLVVNQCPPISNRIAPRVVVKKILIPIPSRSCSYDGLLHNLNNNIGSTKVNKFVGVPSFNSFKPIIPHIITPYIKNNCPMSKAPKVIIKVVPIRLPCSNESQRLNLQSCRQQQFTKTVFVPVWQRPRLIVKKVFITRPPGISTNLHGNELHPTNVNEMNQYTPFASFIRKFSTPEVPEISSTPVGTIKESQPTPIIGKCPIQKCPKVKTMYVPFCKSTGVNFSFTPYDTRIPPRVVVKIIRVPVILKNNLNNKDDFRQQVLNKMPWVMQSKNQPKINAFRPLFNLMPTILPTPVVPMKCPKVKTVYVTIPKKIYQKCPSIPTYHYQPNMFNQYSLPNVPPTSKVIIKVVPIRIPYSLPNSNRTNVNECKQLIKKLYIPVPQRPKIIIQRVPVFSQPSFQINSDQNKLQSNGLGVTLRPKQLPVIVINKHLETPKNLKIPTKTIIIPKLLTNRFSQQKCPFVKPVFISVPCKKLTNEELNLPYRYAQLPPKVLVKKIMVPVILPPRIIYRNCGAHANLLNLMSGSKHNTNLGIMSTVSPPTFINSNLFSPKCPAAKIVYIPITKFVRNKCQHPLQPDINNTNQWQLTPRPPNVIIKVVPIRIPYATNCTKQPGPEYKGRLPVKTVFVPVPQRPMFIIKKVPVPIPIGLNIPLFRNQKYESSTKKPQIVVPPPIVINKCSYPKRTEFTKCPIKTIIVPMPQVMKSRCPISKPVFVFVPSGKVTTNKPFNFDIKNQPSRFIQLPPKIIVKTIPVPMVAPPKIIYKECRNNKGNVSNINDNVLPDLNIGKPSYLHKPPNPNILFSHSPGTCPMTKTVYVPITKVIHHNCAIARKPNFLIKPVPSMQRPPNNNKRLKLVVKVVPIRVPYIPKRFNQINWMNRKICPKTRTIFITVPQQSDNAFKIPVDSQSKMSIPPPIILNKYPPHRGIKTPINMIISPTPNLAKDNAFKQKCHSVKPIYIPVPYCEKQITRPFITNRKQCMQMPPKIIVRKILVPIIPSKETPPVQEQHFNKPNKIDINGDNSFNSFKPKNTHTIHSILPKKCPNVKTVYISVPKFIQSKCKTPSNYFGTPNIMQQPYYNFHPKTKIPPSPRIIVKVVPVRVPYFSQQTVRPNLAECKQRPIVKTVFVPVPQRPKVIVKEINTGSSLDLCRRLIENQLQIKKPTFTPSPVIVNKYPSSKLIKFPAIPTRTIIVPQTKYINKECPVPNYPTKKLVFVPVPFCNRLENGLLKPETVKNYPPQIIRLPPKVVVKKVLVTVPRKVMAKECRFPFNQNVNSNKHPIVPHYPLNFNRLSSLQNQKCSAVRKVYIPVFKFIRNKCTSTQKPNYLIPSNSVPSHNYGSSGVPQSPKIIVKVVPVRVPFLTQGADRSNLLECKYMPIIKKVFVPVSQRPKIIVKKVPVSVTSCLGLIKQQLRPKVPSLNVISDYHFPKHPAKTVFVPTIKYVNKECPVQKCPIWKPVFLQSSNCKTKKQPLHVIRLPPRVIIKKITVPVIQPGKVVYKECKTQSDVGLLNKEDKHGNLYFTRPGSTFGPTFVDKAPSPLFNRCPITKTVYVPIPQVIQGKCTKSPKLIVQGSPNLSQNAIRPNLLKCNNRPIIKHLFVPVLQRPRIIIKKVPVASPGLCFGFNKNNLHSNYNNQNKITTPVQFAINKYPPHKPAEYPKILTRIVVVPKTKFIYTKCPPHNQSPGKVIFMPVPFCQKPSQVQNIKACPAPQIIKIPPKLIIKKIPIFVRSPQKVVYKECRFPSKSKKLDVGSNLHFATPVSLFKYPKLPSPQAGKCPAAKTVYIPVTKFIRNKCTLSSFSQPPKVMIKVIPVRVPYSNQGIVQPSLIQCKHSPLTKTVFVPVFQRPKVIIKKVPVASPSCIRPFPIINNKYQPSKGFEFPKHSIRVSTPITTGNKKSPVQIIRLPPKVIIKKVAVPIIYPPKVIYKKCNMLSNMNQQLLNGNNFKHHNVHFGMPLFSHRPTAPSHSVPLLSASKCPLTKTIYIPYPKLIRNKCIMVQPNKGMWHGLTQPIRGGIGDQRPAKIIVKQIPITKTVFVPVFQRPKVIIKKVPITSHSCVKPPPFIINKNQPFKGLQFPKVSIRVPSSITTSNKKTPVQIIRLPPKVIIKKVAIPIIYPPKVIYKKCNRFSNINRQPIDTNNYKHHNSPLFSYGPTAPSRSISFTSPNKCPLTKTIYVPYPKLIRNRCVVVQPNKGIWHGSTQPPPSSICKQRPPKVIIKTIPIPIRIPSSTQAIVRPNLSECMTKPIVKTIFVPVLQRPKVIITKVPVASQSCIKPFPIINSKYQPSKGFEFPKHSIRVTTPITTGNKKPPCQIIRLPPKVIIKKVAVPVIYPPKVIYKKCNRFSDINRQPFNTNNYKHHNSPLFSYGPTAPSHSVSLTSPNKCPLTKTIYIPYPKLIRNKCVVVQPNKGMWHGPTQPIRGGIGDQRPTKVIVKQIPVTKTVFVPVFQRPKIIIKKVPVISQTCVKPYPISKYQLSKGFRFPKLSIRVSSPKIKPITNKKKPAQVVQLPPKVIIRKVAIPIIYPPKIIYKNCNIFSNMNRHLLNGKKYKHHNVHFGAPLFSYGPAAASPSLSMSSQKKCPPTKTIYIPYPNKGILGGSTQPHPSNICKQRLTKVIIKTIPIPIRIPSPTQTIVRPNLSECKKKTLIKTIFVPVLQRPKIIIKKVPVASQSCIGPFPIINNKYQPSKGFEFPKHSIRVSTPITTGNKKSPVQIIRLPPKVIIKKVAVPIIYPPKVIYKKCNTLSNVNQQLLNGNNFKHHNVHFGMPLFSHRPTAPSHSVPLLSANKCPLTKTVYIPYPKLIRNKCIMVQPNKGMRHGPTQPIRGGIGNQRPMKVIIKMIPIPIRVPYLSYNLKKPSLMKCKQRVVTKTVFVPVPERPKIVIKEVPVLGNKYYQGHIHRPVPAPIIINKCPIKENIKSHKIPTKPIIVTISKPESGKSYLPRCQTVKSILIPVPYCKKYKQMSTPVNWQNVRLPPKVLIKKVFIPVFPPKANLINMNTRPTVKGKIKDALINLLKPFNQKLSILPHNLPSVNNKCSVKTVFIPVPKLIRNKCVYLIPPKSYPSLPNINLHRPQKLFNPPKVIIKVIPIRLPCSQNLNIPKLVNNKQSTNIKKLPSFIRPPPKLVIKQVPKLIFVPIQKQQCSKVKPVYIHVPIFKSPKKESPKCTSYNNQPVRVVQLPPKIIVKKISVPVILPRKTVPRKCPTLPLFNANTANVRPVKKLTPPSFWINSNKQPPLFSRLSQNCPKSKIVYITIPKIVNRKCPISLKGKHVNLPSFYKPNLKLHMPSPISPKVIIKVIPVRVPYVSPKYESQIAAKCKKGESGKTIFIPVPQRPKIIIKEIPIFIRPRKNKMSVGKQYLPKKNGQYKPNTFIPSPIIIKQNRPPNEVKFPKIPTKVIVVHIPKLITKYLWRKCPKKSVYIPVCKKITGSYNTKPIKGFNIQVPPRVIVKKIAVPVILPPKVIYKKCRILGGNANVNVRGKKQPNANFMPQFSPNKLLNIQSSKCPIIKTVYIPVPKLIRNKCITPPNLNYIKKPSFSHLHLPNIYKPFKIPHSPKVIVKLVPIRVSSSTEGIKTKCPTRSKLGIVSPKILIRRIPIYIPKIIHQKCFMPTKSNNFFRPFLNFNNNKQHPATKIVYIPVSQRPRFIIKRIGVPNLNVGQVCPKQKIIINQPRKIIPPPIIINKCRSDKNANRPNIKYIHLPPKVISKIIHIPVIYPCRKVHKKHYPFVDLNNRLNSGNLNLKIGASNNLKPIVKVVYVPVPKIIHTKCPNLRQLNLPWNKKISIQQPKVIVKMIPVRVPYYFPKLKPKDLISLRPQSKLQTKIIIPKILKDSFSADKCLKHVIIPVPKLVIKKVIIPVPMPHKRLNVLSPTHLSRYSVPLSSHFIEHCRFMIEKQTGQIAVLKNLLTGEIKKSKKLCSCDSRPLFSKIMYTPIKKENRCTSPKVIFKLLPIFKPPKTVIKEVRLPFSAKCPPQPILIHRVPVPPVANVVEKEKIVRLPPKVVIKTVFVPLVNASRCPPPKLMLHKVFIPLPSRTIIKEVPIHHPPRIVVKEVPVIKTLPLSHPNINHGASKIKVIYKKIPILQPPRTIIKEVPITLPPRIVFRPIVRYRNKCNSTVSQINHFGSIFSHISRIESSLELHKRIIEYQKTEISSLELEVVKLLKDIIYCSGYAKKSTGKTLAHYYPTRSSIVYNSRHGLLTRDECIKKLHRNENIVLHLREKLKVVKEKTIRNFLINSRLIPNYEKIIKKKNELPRLETDSLPLRNILSILKQRSGTSNRIHPSLFMHGFATTPRINYKNSNSRSSLACLPKESLNEIYTAYTQIQTALTHCMNSALISNFKQNGSNDRYKNYDRHQLIEEKRLAEGQIDFLNSIIVDMQKKNAEQKAKIEILESGYSSSAAEELNLMGLPQHKRPPRAYCDICEEFDLHETEDCPLQATEEHSDKRISPRKAPPPPRPYCEICEIFGHCTEDCKDDQTY